MKHIPLLVLFVVTSLSSSACDACGCAIGGMGFGYVPFQKNHFVGLSYQHHSFETVHPALFSTETEEVSNDQFQTIQLWGRFFIGDRFLVSGFMPLKQNTVESTTENHHIRGFGDARIQALYLVKSVGHAMSTSQLTWYAGFGAYLPTGRIDEESRIHLPNLQPGSGAFGAEFNSTFSARNNDLGFRSELNLRTNGSNRYHYRFGNELNANMVLFYRWKWKQFRLMPQAGAALLARAVDIEDVQRDIANTLSGVNLFSGVIGLSIYTERIGLRCFQSVPLQHHISNGYTSPKLLTNLQLLYLIPSKNTSK